MLRKIYLVVALAVFSNFLMSQTGPGFIEVTRGSNLHVPRISPNVASLPGGKAIVIGGHTTGFNLTATAEIYDPATGNWSLVNTQNARDMAGLSRLNDGRILVFGGCSSGWGVGQLASAEIFDPAGEEFTSTGSMTVMRTNCGGTTLTDGRVLVRGNWYHHDNYGDIYDPDSGTWSSTGASIAARSHPVVLPTDDGGAVIIGGYGIYGGSGVDVVEYYDANTNTFSQLQSEIITGEPGWMAGGAGQRLAEEFRLYDGRYLFMIYRAVGSGQNEYTFATFDPETKVIERLVTTPSVLTYGIGQADTFAYSVFIMIKQATGHVFIMGSYKSGDFYNAMAGLDLNNGNLYIPETGLKGHYYYNWGHAPFWLPNGDIMMAGGTTLDNFTALDSVMIIRPQQVFTGVGEAHEYGEFQAYPNPVTDHLNIQLPPVSGTLRMFDPLGRVVWQHTANGTSNLLALPMAAYVPGVYFLEFSGESGRITLKIVRTR